MPRVNIAVPRASKDALGVLGNQIKIGRRRRGWTITDLAERLGIDPRTVSGIEAGSPSVSIGNVFNAAFLVGVDLFGLSGPELARARRAGEETLALLPANVRKPRVRDSANDFAF
ncbi:MAG: helix-turn-helix transcriptional regulator [Acidimicrobiaceae bacterium]|nr:helix-turn-helix transcriptional regulator [Acidimicrobiaceae bacterium]